MDKLEKEIADWCNQYKDPLGAAIDLIMHMKTDVAKLVEGLELMSKYKSPQVLKQIARETLESVRGK